MPGATGRPSRSVPFHIHWPAAPPSPWETRRPRVSKTSNRTGPTAPDQSTRTEPGAGLGVACIANAAVTGVGGTGGGAVGLPMIRNASTWSAAWIHGPLESGRAKYGPTPALKMGDSSPRIRRLSHVTGAD